jgi:hypothetical protein
MSFEEKSAWVMGLLAAAAYAVYPAVAILGSAAKIVAYRRGFQPW